MMKLEDAHSVLDEWFEKGCVGNITFFRAPRASRVDCYLERTIKLRELNKGRKDLIEQVFAEFDFSKAELFRDSNGTPDRIKVSVAKV